jgi:ubiquinone/menaquinone biosynthesis C-methylase UbiE
MIHPRAYLGYLLVVLVPSVVSGQEKAAARRAPDVHFVPTESTMVRSMLKVAKVGKSDVVYDLGCGDGRIVIAAVKEFRAKRGVCVDIDPVRIEESRRNADTAGVARRITFREGDLFQMDLREATVVTLYLLPALNERLRPKLFRELKPGSRVVSNSFDMGDWKADSTLNGNPKAQFFNFAYYWVMPADVAGTWRLKVKDGGSYTLGLEQRYQHVTGTVSAEAGQAELSEFVLKGDSLRFAISDSLRFSGRVKGERAEGRVTGAGKSRSWTAERVKKAKRTEVMEQPDTSVKSERSAR